MKRSILFLLLFSSFVVAAPAAAQEKIILGPKKYDVKERYGKENAYTETFNSAEGFYVLKLQNGDTPRERSEFIELSLNGEKLLKDGKYDVNFLASVVTLNKGENSLSLVLKDAKPSGLKRPPLPPRFVTISVLPLTEKLPKGTYALDRWERLKETADLLRKIASPESAAPAAKSINLQHDLEQRAEAMRKLSDRKDLSAQPFILSVFNNYQEHPDVRGEAAIALGLLGDKNSIPSLISGVLDPEEKTRLGSTRALSFYPESETREPLTKMLERLDSMRRDAVIRAIVNGGWKPVGALLSLAESPDPSASHTAISLLGYTGEPRVTEVLLKMLEQPGTRNPKVIITALGKTGDSRAIEPLSRMAKDRSKRAGKEGELGEALADLGDKNSIGTIEDMIKRADNRQTWFQLQQAYRKLTGKDYK